MSPAVLRAELTLRSGSLTISAGLEVGADNLVLVGPNAAGKTSALLGLLGLLPVDHGQIALGERLLFDSATGLSLPTEERRLGFVPQDYALFPHLSAAENVGFALAASRGGLPRAARDRRAHELLGELGVAESAEQRPEALSGGQRQRVALARALAAEPVALLLDEPFAALDAETRPEIRAFVVHTLGARRCPFLLVTHDLADAAATRAPIAVMEGGLIVQSGSLAELRAAPATDYIHKLTS